jgi:hypothetical protein
MWNRQSEQNIVLYLYSVLLFPNLRKTPGTRKEALIIDPLINTFRHFNCLDEKRKTEYSFMEPSFAEPLWCTHTWLVRTQTKWGSRAAMHPLPVS